MVVGGQGHTYKEALLRTLARADALDEETASGGATASGHQPQHAPPLEQGEPCSQQPRWDKMPSTASELGRFKAQVRGHKHERGRSRTPSRYTERQPPPTQVKKQAHQVPGPRNGMPKALPSLASRYAPSGLLPPLQNAELQQLQGTRTDVPSDISSDELEEDKEDKHLAKDFDPTTVTGQRPQSGNRAGKNRSTWARAARVAAYKAEIAQKAAAAAALETQEMQGEANRRQRVQDIKAETKLERSDIRSPSRPPSGRRRVQTPDRAEEGNFVDPQEGPPEPHIQPGQTPDGYVTFDQISQEAQLRLKNGLNYNPDYDHNWVYISQALAILLRYGSCKPKWDPVKVRLEASQYDADGYVEVNTLATMLGITPSTIFTVASGSVDRQGMQRFHCIFDDEGWGRLGVVQPVGKKARARQQLRDDQYEQTYPQFQPKDYRPPVGAGEFATKAPEKSHPKGGAKGKSKSKGKGKAKGKNPRSDAKGHKASSSHETSQQEQPDVHYIEDEDEDLDTESWGHWST